MKKKKMVQGLPSLLTHATSVYHDNVTLPKFVQRKDLSKNC